MAIPKALVEQAEAAEELHKKLYATTPEGTPAETVIPQEEATESAPEESQQQQELEAQEQPAQPAQEKQAKQEKTEVQEPVQEGDYSSLQRAYQKLLKSYEILQNKYNLGKNQEEYRAALEARDNRIANLEMEIANLKNQLLSAPETPEKQEAISVPAEMQKLFEEIKTDVGDETAEKLAKYFQLVATQVAQNTASQIVTPIGEELSAVKQEVDGVRKSTMEKLSEQYIADLTALCPDWESIKNDPGFAEYLGGIDVGSGVTRYDLAESRMKALDAEGVAYWYNAYKREIGLPVGDTSQRRTSHTPPKKGKETLIAPVSQSKGAVPQQEKPFLTTTQLRAMEKQIIDLQRTGKIEEARKIEAAINSAIAERRIVQG